MSLPIPNLDDRDFEDLLQEAKSLIPIYNKDWTNHNPSDPGITLLELFAWLSEMINYRINQVTEENYRAFLKLLGIEHIFHWDGVPGADNDRLLNFLTRNYGIIWAQDPTVEKSADQTIIISDGKNKVSFNLGNDHQVIIGFDTGKNDELTAISESLFCWDDIPGAGEGQLLEFVNERFGLKNAVIQKTSDGAGISVSDNSGKIISLALNQSRDYLMVTSFDGQKSQLKTTKKNGRLKVTGLKIYDLIARDIQRGLESLESSSKRYRAITSGDYESLTRECMKLLHPDLKGRVICMNNLAWNRGTVQVKPGHISVVVIPAFETPEFCWDDLVAEENDTLRRFLGKVDDSEWIRKAAIAISSDRTEIIIRDQTPGSKREMWLKLNTFSGKVNVVGDTFHNLEFETKSENGKRNIFLYCTSDCKPTELLLAKIKQYLDQRRLITTRLHVVPPDYQPVKIEAILAAQSNTITGDLEKKVSSIVATYFSPLTGGKTGQGWPLGRNLYRSEIYHLLEGIPGIDHVIDLTLGGTNDNLLEIGSYRLISPASDIKVKVV